MALFVAAKGLLWRFVRETSAAGGSENNRQPLLGPLSSQLARCHLPCLRYI